MYSLPTVDIHLDENGYIWFKFKTDQIIELEQAKEFVKIINELSGNQKRSVILDTRGTHVTGNSEARKYIGKSPEALKWRKADALLFDSLPVMIVGNFYMKFDTSDHPVKLFRNEVKALKWLRSLD